MMFSLPDRQGVEATQAHSPPQGPHSRPPPCLTGQEAHPTKACDPPRDGGGLRGRALSWPPRPEQSARIVQFTVWQAGHDGYLFADELTRGPAPERRRGVRLLVDDNGIAGADPKTSGARPDLAISRCACSPLYSAPVQNLPVPLRFDFFRETGRMHNKPFTADGAAQLVGGAPMW